MGAPLLRADRALEGRLVGPPGEGGVVNLRGERGGFFTTGPGFSRHFVENARPWRLANPLNRRGEAAKSG